MTREPGADRGGALERAVAELETLALDRLSPGDQLPGEGTLAETLGVSRLTVREAVKQLSARGIILTSNGRRPVVAEPDGRSVGDFLRTEIRRDPATLLELVDVRVALESQIAALAAGADETALGPADDALAAMVAALDDRDAFNDADVRFHAALAGATGNSLLAILLAQMEGVLRSSRDLSTEGHRRRGLGLGDIVEQHREILAHARAHDPAAAAEAMRRHLESARDDLTAELGHRPPRTR